MKVTNFTEQITPFSKCANQELNFSVYCNGKEVCKFVTAKEAKKVAKALQKIYAEYDYSYTIKTVTI
jgi:hypothetical protein